jgi:hypothetical protein
VWVETSKRQITETIGEMVELIARCDALANQVSGRRLPAYETVCGPT